MDETDKAMDPFLDTGEWRKEMRRLLQELIAREKTIEDMNTTVILTAKELRQMKAEWEADHKQRVTFATALKRGVMQILKGIGWID